MKVISSAAKGAYKDGEDKDCFVRAISNVTGEDYDKVHNMCAVYGRQDGKGSNWNVCHKVFEYYGFTGIAVSKTKAARFMASFMSGIITDHDLTSKTLGNCVKELQAGKYILFVNGHAISLIDGKIIDIGDNKSQQQVHAIFWLPEQFKGVNNGK